MLEKTTALSLFSMGRAKSTLIYLDIFSPGVQNSMIKSKSLSLDIQLAWARAENFLVIHSTPLLQVSAVNP